MRTSLNLPHNSNQHLLTHPLGPASRSRWTNSRLAVPTPGVAVPDVVDADPDREQRVLARPRRALGLLARPLQEVVCLNGERTRRMARRDEALVDRRTADGVVVRQHEGRVELGCQDIDVVRAARRGLARVRGVAEGVARRGDGAGGVEPAGGVRVTARCACAGEFVRETRKEWECLQDKPEVCAGEAGRVALGAVDAGDEDN